MTQDPPALIAAGLAALRARDMVRAAECLRDAAGSAPDAAMPWVALAQAELALGRNDAAEAAIDRELLRAPREVGALLLKGLLRERVPDARAAVSFYRAAINQAAADNALAPALAGLHTHAQRYVSETDGVFGRFLDAELGRELSPTMRENRRSPEGPP